MRKLILMVVVARSMCRLYARCSPVVLMLSVFGAVQSAVVWAGGRTAGLNDCINGGEELGETL